MAREKVNWLNSKNRVMALAITFLLFSLFLPAGCGRQQPPGQEAGAASIPVSTVKAKKDALQSVPVVTGKLEARESSNVVPKVAGKIAAVHVDVGSAIQAGDVLVTLDNSDLSARAEQARAAVVAAESALASAQTAFAVTEANYRRGKELLAQGAISKALFEAEYDLKYKQAKEQVERALPAQLAQVGAALTLAEAAYNDSMIKAPISGRVMNRYVNPGEMANTMSPVVSLVNLDKVVVKVSIGENLVNQLKDGQKVQVKINAVSSQPFTGLVTNIAPGSDPVTKGFPVKIEIDNPDYVLKPGMFAEVKITSSEKEHLLVPREAVVKVGGKDVVWVIQENQAKMKEVGLGESDGKQIAVLSGLSEGEEVVVKGQGSLQEGISVNVRNNEGS